MKVSGKAHQTIHRGPRLSVVPAINRLFGQPGLLFKTIFCHLKVLQQKSEPLRKRRSLPKAPLSGRIRQSKQIIRGAMKVLRKPDKRIHIRKPVPAQKGSQRGRIDPRCFGKCRRPNLRFCHQIFQVLRQIRHNSIKLSQQPSYPAEQIIERAIKRLCDPDEIVHGRQTLSRQPIIKYAPRNTRALDKSILRGVRLRKDGAQALAKGLHGLVSNLLTWILL